MHRCQKTAIVPSVVVQCPQDANTFIADNVGTNANSNQEEECADTFIEKSLPARSLNLTEIVQQMNIDDDGTEVESRACDNSILSVRGYIVKPQYVDLLASILSRYGDIAANCHDKPVSILSLYVEFACVILEKLGSTEFVKVTRNELEEMLASLSHLEGEGLNVGWLKERVEEIYDAHVAVSMLRSTKQRLVDDKSKVRRLEEEIKVYNQELANLQNKIGVAKNVLCEEKAKVEATKTLMSDYKAKVQHVYQLKSLTDNLL